MAPGPPCPYPLTATHMALCWSDRRSHGAKITAYRVWRKQCDNREESQHHEDSVAQHLHVKVGSVHYASGTLRALATEGPCYHHQ
jgi:hypothetical protein